MNCSVTAFSVVAKDLSMATKGLISPSCSKRNDADPYSAGRKFFLGIASLDQNRVDEAEKSLRETLLRRSADADVYLVLADFHARKKDYGSQVQD